MGNDGFAGRADLDPAPTFVVVIDKQELAVGHRWPGFIGDIERRDAPAVGDVFVVKRKPVDEGAAVRMKNLKYRRGGNRFVPIGRRVISLEQGLVEKRVPLGVVRVAGSGITAEDDLFAFEKEDAV